jgi:hypothetical protein
VQFRGDRREHRDSSSENQGNVVDLAARKAVSATGNGKLTPELFAAAGIAVTDTADKANHGSFGANVRSKRFFEEAIAAEWRKNVDGIIKTGKFLLDAKEELDRDVFGALKLPFDLRVSQMLRRIASHPVISDAKHASRLPACWRTLYELTRIDDDLLRAALADGRIHPALQRKDIRGKILGLPPREKKEPPEPPAPEPPAPLPPLALRKQLEDYGLTRFRQEILPPDWRTPLMDTALALATPEQLIAMLERKCAPSKSARAALKSLKKSPPTNS